MALRNFKIGTRLGIGFGSILAILMIVVVAANTLNYRNKAQLLTGLELASEKNTQAAAMKSAMLETGISMRNIGLQSDVGLMQAEEGKVGKSRKLYEGARDKLATLGLSTSEKTLLANIAALDREVDGAFKEAMSQVLAFNSEGGAKIIAKRIDPLNQKMLADINQLLQLQQQAQQSFMASSLEGDKQLMLVLLVLGGVAVLLGAWCAVFITRSITVPLSGAVAVAQQVAAGELTAHVAVQGRDETSALQQALRDMNDSLVRTVSAVRQGTQAITVASGEIASGNADLSARTETQASSLEETASSMEELTSTVKQNADNARQANQLAVSASSVAQQGGSVVSQVVDTMGAIKDSSRKIVDIIAVIDGIAFQTNILALNAAVEAARAGEQGRGFAVVATEVRNLAQRSAAAAREIKGLIGDSVEKVDTGSRLVDEAGQTMELVVTSIRQVADIMGEITAATQEQSHGIEEVNQAISQMDEMTQQNAALVEQAAAAAESMQEQSLRLAEAVSAFKLAGDGAMVQRAPLPAAPPVAVVARVAVAAPRPAPKAALPAAEKKLAAAGGDDWEEF
ncbi:methyl-accepting chemotaxis protein [Janthinobacterium aquaticum]|uniref:methyl-accepting chemotaxis protein n=1 Tax=Janthinobacterium sp. FT58W TaxID=2654254 RepID=UPI0012659038|nr:methyl-accepting chemotaxis protein [Janthinobacterium sp. FT58W]KAB8042722.1 HAMP domain-containing protein [Janthinobacterium sp. FT58W]